MNVYGTWKSLNTSTCRPMLCGQTFSLGANGRSPVEFSYLCPIRHSRGCSTVLGLCVHLNVDTASCSVSWVQCIVVLVFPPVRTHCTSLHIVGTAQQCARGLHDHLACCGCRDNSRTVGFSIVLAGRRAVALMHTHASKTPFFDSPWSTTA